MIWHAAIAISPPRATMPSIAIPGAGAAKAAGPNDRPADPYLGYLFTVKIDGAPEPVGGFSDVSGLNIETEVETMRVGGINDHDVMLPGASKFPSRIVLKRGIAQGSFLWSWYVSVMKSSIVRHDITITMRGPRQEVGPSWTFRQACPVKWTGPELRAANSAVAFESIDVIHCGLQL